MPQPTDTKRWMFILTTEQYNWIKETSAQANVDGVVLVRLLLDKAIADRTGKLLLELSEAQLKAELQQVNNEIAEREERRQQLSKQLRRDKVLA